MGTASLASMESHGSGREVQQVLEARCQVNARKPARRMKSTIASARTLQTRPRARAVQSYNVTAGSARPLVRHKFC